MVDYKSVVHDIARSKKLEIAPNWAGLSAVVPLLETIRLDGVLVVIKLDGTVRGAHPYTVLFTGGVLGEEYVRTSGPDLDEAVGRAVINYARRRWGFVG